MHTDTGTETSPSIPVQDVRGCDDQDCKSWKSYPFGFYGTCPVCGAADPRNPLF